MSKGQPSKDQPLGYIRHEDWCDQTVGMSACTCGARKRYELAHAPPPSKPKLYLPLITAEIADLLEGSSVIEKDETATSGWNWTQDAVEFACILNRQLSTADETPEPHRGDDIDPKLAQIAWYHIQQFAAGVAPDITVREAVQRVFSMTAADHSTLADDLRARGFQPKPVGSK